MRKKPEKVFEAEIELVSNTIGWKYFKIPDTTMIHSENRKTHKEKKRPFDGFLATHTGNVAVECKYQYNTLDDHQKEAGEYIHKKNGLFIVLRKVDRKTETAYIREDVYGNRIEEHKSCRDMLLSVNNLFNNQNITK